MVEKKNALQENENANPRIGETMKRVVLAVVIHCECDPNAGLVK